MNPAAPRALGRRWLELNLLGALLTLGALAAALAIGPSGINPALAMVAPEGSPERAILFGARLPRVLVAALVGGALGTGGAALQALLRNPLACPHVLGISGGAALLAVVVAGLSTGALGWVTLAGPGLLVPAAAFVGALASAALVQGIARATGRATPQTLLLSGVVFNAFSAAAITLISAVVEPTQVQNLLGWVVGAIAVRGNLWTGVAALTLAAGLAVLVFAARDLNALGLGEEGARSLGVNVRRTRLRVYLAVALLVAGAVPVSGMVGFVGLIVPHAVRLLVGADHRLVLVGSAWGGAVFLVLADTLARTVLAPVDLPVGVVTAFCGGPFFLFLLARQGRAGGRPS